jgi:hypothetical protein
MSNTVTVNTCTKYCVKECPYFEIESNTFFSDNIGHTFYSCAYLDMCKKALSLKEKEQEEPKEKSNAEIYVDFLEYLLTSAIAMIEKENSKGETDIYLIGRRDGLKSAFTNVMKMILDFKEENAEEKK